MKPSETAKKIIQVLGQMEAVSNYSDPYSNGNGVRYIAVLIKLRKEKSVSDALFSDKSLGVFGFSFLRRSVKFCKPLGRNGVDPEQTWEIAFREGEKDVERGEISAG